MSRAFPLAAGLAALALATGCADMMEKAVPAQLDNPARQYVEALAAEDWETARDLAGPSADEDDLRNQAAIVGAEPIDRIRVAGFSWQQNFGHVIYVLEREGRARPMGVNVYVDQTPEGRTVSLEAAPPGAEMALDMMNWGWTVCCGTVAVGVLVVAGVIVLIIVFVRRGRRKREAREARGDSGPVPPPPPPPEARM